MAAAPKTDFPLVSVIIPCYNHGRYLQEAVQSVWSQNYPATEVLVVDDGSTDDTREAAAACAGVRYIYQANQGLSAARNTGIRHSQGEFLVFLDADDWLLPDAIRTNVRWLQQDKRLAFVSGGHDKVFVEEGITKADLTEVKDNHYQHLLQGNYIGMHATVMYRRQIFDEVLYDTTLKRCEDYDLYLRIARKHPVLHHCQRIAAYRLHTTNMSANIPAMLGTVLEVLARQQSQLQTAAEQSAYRRGQRVWKNYYCQELYRKALAKKVPVTKEVIFTLLKHQPSLIPRYMLTPYASAIKSRIRKNAPAFGLRWLHRMGLHKEYVPAVGKADLGDFDSTRPFSKNFGYDRGGPVDRYYIENFLQQEAGSIYGRVLEIGDNEYTLRFGGNQVAQSDILHVDASNPKATFVGDISDAPHLPDNTFDCLVLTQTLHLIYDFKGALRTCHRVLKPGGVLLLTVPGITPIDHGEWKETWYWSFTDKAMRRLMEETFAGGHADVNCFGNVFAATAFLYGMGLPEVPRARLDFNDPHYQVVVTVKAVKAPTA
ncbi:glycosyltransferase [Pontibacter russatus]|uniref:glycosyltransferase n=1 Tax=Pontibacter russatus TaxID=2694929 RepID=UPI001379EA7E|nr:glycosyltransferase [Pontibacter russatus]